MPEVIALPEDAPFGAVTVDKDKCTLCMSCVSACPVSALQDNQAAPQLRFIEKNCVQCGLCEKTCPEDAIALVPRLLTTAARKEALKRLAKAATRDAKARDAIDVGTEASLAKAFKELEKAITEKTRAKFVLETGVAAEAKF